MQEICYFIMDIIAYTNYIIIISIVFGIALYFTGELLKLLNNISNCPDPHKRDRLFEPLQEIITFVQFANDECDYGMGLELGLDLFSHGEHFHRVVSHLLMVAYDLLQREEYGQRLEQHLAHRSHTPLDLSSSPASPPSRK